MNNYNIPEKEGSENKELKIDLWAIFHTVLRKWWVIFLTVVVTVSLAFLISWLQEPEYASVSSLFVKGTSATTDQQITSNTQSIATSMTRSFEYVIKNHPILNQAGSILSEEGINNPDTGRQYTYAQLYNMITVTTTSGTQVLNIRVVAESKEDSREIANAVAEAAAQYLTETIGVETILCDNAGTGSQTNDNLIRNLLIAVVLGVVLSVAVIIIVFMVNDRIKTAEDIEKWLGISVIGEVPVTEKAGSTASFVKRKRKGA